MVKKDVHRTVEDCDKIHLEKSNFNRWLIRIVLCIFCVGLGITTTIFVAHASNDHRQDVSIGKMETQLLRIPRMEAKIDILIERSAKRP